MTHSVSLINSCGNAEFSPRTCSNITQVVVKFNWLESVGKHICYQMDATDYLPSRNLLYSMMLTEHICIQISKVTFPTLFSIIRGFSPPSSTHAHHTDLRQPLSSSPFLSSSFFFPGYSAFFLRYNQGSSEHWWYVCSQCAALHFSVSNHKTRSSLELWLLTQSSQEFWSWGFKCFEEEEYTLWRNPLL